jgi:hypothetical protein
MTMAKKTSKSAGKVGGDLVAVVCRQFRQDLALDTVVITQNRRRECALQVTKMTENQGQIHGLRTWRWNI